MATPKNVTTKIVATLTFVAVKIIQFRKPWQPFIFEFPHKLQKAKSVAI